MKKYIFLLALLGIVLNSNAQRKQWYSYPEASSLASGDLFVIYQSGSSKNIQYLYLGNVISDSSDVLRAELPPLWRTDIADTADVLRVEIAAASTIDTAWARLNEYVILRFINDSVGVGTTSPDTKFEVVGTIKATSLFLADAQDNITIGENAGAALGASNDDNIFIGKNSGLNATGDGDGNIGVGVLSLQSLTTGTNNIGIGAGDGFLITTGDNNVLLNASASNLTTGDNNVFVGRLAGNSCATSSTDNVFIGSNAGYDADVNNSVFIGKDAGYNYDQAGGVGIGHEAGEESTSSVGLTAVGYEAATALTESDYHTVMGYQALDAIQTSDGSTVMGYQAGSAATGAAAFTVVGYKSGEATTTGDGNSLFGYETGVDIITGSRNTLSGQQSGYTLTDGANNTFVGWQSGYGGGVSVTGSVYLGYQAGYNNQSDSILIIDNSQSDSLIWGDFAADSLVVNDKLTVATQVLIDPSVTGTATDPSLAFGDGNTGFYEDSDNNLYLSIGGTQYWYWTSNSLRAINSKGASITGSDATPTVPTILPRRIDSNTGIGHTDDSDDNLSLIAGGVEGIRITEVGGITTVLATDTLRTTDYAGGPSGWATESDRRVKQNIEPITDGLAIVRKLEGVRYERKDKPGVTKVGFIAQDVEKVLPEVVNPGNLYTMESAQITAVLVEAVKEQQRQINKLKMILIYLPIMFGAFGLVGFLIFFIKQRRTIKT